MPKVHGHGNGGKKKLASGKQSSRSIVQNGNTVAAAASASTSGGSPNNIGKRFQHQNFNKNIYIGTKNAEKWERTRIRLGLKNDVEFVTYLLKLADGEVTNKFPESTPLDASEVSTGGETSYNDTASVFVVAVVPPVTTKAKSKTKSKKKSPKLLRKLARVGGEELDGVAVSNGNCNHSYSSIIHDSIYDKSASIHQSFPIHLDTNTAAAMINSDDTAEVLDCRIAEKIQNELENKLSSEECTKAIATAISSASTAKATAATKISESLTVPTKAKRKIIFKEKRRNKLRKYEATGGPSRLEELLSTDNLPRQIMKSEMRRLKRIKRGYVEEEGDEGGAEANEAPAELDASRNDSVDGEEQETNEAIANTTNNEKCPYCKVRHNGYACPITSADVQIPDALNYQKWLFDACNDKMANEYEVNEEEQESTGEQEPDEDVIPYSEASLPPEFEIKAKNTKRLGVFAKIPIGKYMRLGPLQGPFVDEVDISDDSTLEHVIEMNNGQKSTFVNVEDDMKSNWLKYVQPAPSSIDRNTVLVRESNEIYFITCTEVPAGSELLYWSDKCNTRWKKNVGGKTNCGGCNMKFDHPLHYRTHCSIFHDPKVSLTIRKYYCKICGSIHLGKENITKHAAEMHEGKGAYQCQYCKKFFLRLNYLDMHRTYGCNANPQRTRPLCDFCGRKFCQPQKLKVHIKRMHSDMADVLREFQCKICKKLLGSRAALQRHSKEVHSRDAAVVSCPRCQKIFQNRSNLKIHMLTHSGVRPFKCAEPSCTAAFTTKQCLQFHYKKVHQYVQEQIPKIERSVAYTFDAYSGGLQLGYEEKGRRRQKNKGPNTPSTYDYRNESESSNDAFAVFRNFSKYKKYKLKESGSSGMPTEINMNDNNYTSQSQPERDDHHEMEQETDANEKESNEDESQSTSSEEISLIDPKLFDSMSDGMIANESNSEFPDADKKPNKNIKFVDDHDGIDDNLDDNDVADRDVDDGELERTVATTTVTAIAVADDLSMTKPDKKVNSFASKGSRKWIDTSAFEKSMSELDQHKNINMYRIQMLMNKQLREGHDLSQILDNEADTPIHTRPASPLQSAPNFMTPLYGSSILSNAAKSSSAVSLLVEAALNSVANNGDGKDLKSTYCIDQAAMNCYHSNHNEAGMCGNKTYGSMDEIDDSETKMLKAQQHFPVLNLSAGNPLALMKEADKRIDSEIDVDSGSTHTVEDYLGSENLHHDDGHMRKATSMHLEENATPSPRDSYISPVASLARNPRLSNDEEIDCSSGSPALNLYNGNYDAGIFRKRLDMVDRNKKYNMNSSSDEENSMLPQNLNIQNHGLDDVRMKLNYSKYNVNSSVGSASNNFLDVKSKYLEQHFEPSFLRGAFSSNVNDALNENQGLDMTNRNNVEYQNNLYLGQNQSSSGTGHLSGVGGSSGNRYHHHIYDILSDREAQQHMDMPQMPHHQSQMLDHGIHNDGINGEQIDTVDLSRNTANYHQQNSSSFSYSHSCSDILRSTDPTAVAAAAAAVANCASGLGGGTSSVNSSPSTFLLSQGQHGHSLRGDGPGDYHRFASGSDQHRFLVSNNISIDHHSLPNAASRLLLDTSSFVLEPNNRIINDESNRQLGSSRGFSPYQQVAPSNYQHSIHSVNPSNYHAFSPYY